MLNVKSSCRFSDRVIRDTSLSFEARSLYLLIDSLSIAARKSPAPSITTLASATGWTAKAIERYGSELAAHNVIMEVSGPEKQYVVLPRPKAAGKSENQTKPADRRRKIIPRELLSQEEINALLTGLC